MRSAKFMQYGVKTKKLKKQTEKDQRLLEAHRKTVLATVAAMCHGAAEQAKTNLNALTPDEYALLCHIVSQADSCLDRVVLGKKAVLRALDTYVPTITKMVEDHISPAARVGMGQYIIVWVLLSYLLGEAVVRAVPDQDKERWQGLSDTVAEWTELVIASAKRPGYYESVGGVLADKAERYLFQQGRIK